MKLIYACLSMLCLFLNFVQAEVKTFKIGVEFQDYFPHYSYVDGKYVGFAKDVFDKFAESKGYQFTYEALPVMRLHQAFWAGEVDFKYPDHPSFAKELKEGKNIIYSKAVSGFADGLMILPEKKGKLKIEDIKSIGTVRGFTPWDYMGQIKAGKIVLEEANDFGNLLEMLLRGRIDGAYVNPVVAEYQLANILKKPGAIVFDESLPHTRSEYQFATIKHPEVIEEFNKFLQDEAEFINKQKNSYNIK